MVRPTYRALAAAGVSGDGGLRRNEANATACCVRRPTRREMRAREAAVQNRTGADAASPGHPIRIHHPLNKKFITSPSCTT